MKEDTNYFIKTASVLLLSAILLFSTAAVSVNTDTITRHSIQKVSSHVNSSPSKPLTRFDDIIWDMAVEESWDTFEYRELTFDISSYTGQPIQIAWRYVGIDGESFGLDDITVTADSSPILIQGFEEGIMPPTGWSVINTNPAHNWDIVDYATYPTYVHSGSYAGWVNYDTPNPSDEWLFSPTIDLTGVTTISIDFWGESDTEFPTATMQLHILGAEEFTCDAGGPYTGYVNETVQFLGDAIGGFYPYMWAWSFGDGDTADAQNPTHIFTKTGMYNVTLTVTDALNATATSETTAYITERPTTPILTGPSKGIVDMEYSFTITSTDPEGNNLSYLINWDDGSYPEWVGPYSSGMMVNVSHSWSYQGKYKITAMAKNSNDVESNWSAPHMMLITPVFTNASLYGVFLQYYELPEENITYLIPFYGLFIQSNPRSIKFYLPGVTSPVAIMIDTSAPMGTILPGLINIGYYPLGIVYGKFSVLVMGY
jgi:hypothetical protein